MIRMCCVCQKSEFEGQWQRIPAVAAKKVSHVYCPLCYEDLMADIERFALQTLSKSVYAVVNTGQYQVA